MGYVIGLVLGFVGVVVGGILIVVLLWGPVKSAAEWGVDKVRGEEIAQAPPTATAVSPARTPIPTSTAVPAARTPGPPSTTGPPARPPVPTSTAVPERGPEPTTRPDEVQSYVSPTYGYLLSWDEPWTEVSRQASPELDRLRLTNGVSQVVLTGTERFGGDPERCLTGVVDGIRGVAIPGSLQPAPARDGEAREGGRDGERFGTYVYTAQDQGAPVPWTAYVRCISLVPGQADLAILHNARRPDYSEQIAPRDDLLAGLALPDFVRVRERGHPRGEPTRATRPRMGTITELLPVQSDLPRGSIQVDAGGRAGLEITRTFPDPEDAARRFDEWNWQENAFRNFVMPGGTTTVEVSAHRFGSGAAAAEVLPYFADARAAILGLNTTFAEPIGDQSLAIGGPVPEGSEVTRYIRLEAVVVRVTAVSSSGNPTGDAEAMAQLVLAASTGADDERGETADVSLTGMLPAEEDVPLGLVRGEDRMRTLAEVSALYADPPEVVRRFAAWGWLGNAFRDFAVPDGAAPATRTTYISISLHRFDRADGAAEALSYALADEAAQFSYQEVSTRPLGNQSRALVGTTAPGNEIVLFVRKQDTLIVVYALSPAGDPAADAVTVAESILAK